MHLSVCICVNCRFFQVNPSSFFFPRDILKTIALGQMLSLCICGTAITSQYLAEKYRVNTPMLQSFINYCLLFLVYTLMLAFQSGTSHVGIIAP